MTFTVFFDDKWGKCLRMAELVAIPRVGDYIKLPDDKRLDDVTYVVKTVTWEINTETDNSFVYVELETIGK